MAEEITVSHNTIYQCPRAAICINDGCWGGHVIEHNDAFNTVRESGDHGPFKSGVGTGSGRPIPTVDATSNLTNAPGLLDNRKTTVIRNNRFAHQGGHSWGIDLDDGSSNYAVCRNLCLGMGIKFREGFFRRVENNIIVNGFGGFRIWLPGATTSLRRNVFVSDKPYQFIGADPHRASEFDYNLFFNPAGEPIITGFKGNLTLAEWRRLGFDRHSQIGDPMFIDPEHGDYRVHPGSPALALGFNNFPMDQFGVRKPAFHREAAREPRVYGVPEPRTLNRDERHQWLGATIKNLVGEGEKSAVGIGDETGRAAGRSRSRQ